MSSLLKRPVYDKHSLLILVYLQEKFPGGSKNFYKK